jgi:hypothetical protein
MNGRASILDKSIEFDATHSWNGFSYQGKIGMIAVLDLICTLVENGKGVERYSLEFEFMEDFSIKLDDNYIQIHQVKSYAEKPLSEYKDAIWILLGKSVFEMHNATIRKAFLHTAQPIKIHQTEINSKELIKKKLVSYDPPAASKSNKNVNPLEFYHYVINNGKLEEAFNKFELYDYGNGKKYCTLENVEQTLKERINKYYKIVGKERELLQKGLLTRYIDCAYLHLLGLIDNYINKRHQDRQNDTSEKKIISFLEIKNVLDTDYSKLPQEYYVYYIRNKLSTVFNDYYLECKQAYSNYMEEIEDQATLVKLAEADKMIDELFSFFQELYTKLDDSALLRMCYKINPHINVNLEENLLAIDQYVNTEFLRNPFLEALSRFYSHISKEDLCVETKNKYYLISTIYNTCLSSNTNDPITKMRLKALEEASISRIAIGILENTKIYTELFNVDGILTANIKDRTLNKYISEAHTYRSILESSDEENKHHIMKIKDIEFIDLEKCEERIANHDTK